jgi:3-oxoacyl-[acyl-carrier protein] reductase
MDLGLTDRVYIVTGASTEMGRACADQLVAEGARLVLTGGDEDHLRVTAGELGGPERAITVSGDLADPGWETCLVAAAVARYGRLDGALVSVDVPPGVTVMQASDEQWRQSFESTFLGTMRLCRAVGSTVSFEGGSLVLVLSTAAKESVRNDALSNGLHPGLAMLAKNLGEELGPRNVRMNSVLPGLVGHDTQPHGGNSPTPEEDSSSVTENPVPAHLLGEPLEFARPAVFLLSPAASFVSGTVLTVDGGRLRSL